MYRLLTTLISGLTVALVFLPAFAAEKNEVDKTAATDEEVTVVEKQSGNISVPSGFGSSRLRSWYVLDNDNLIIETTGGQKYRATFMNRCQGLRFAESLGFGTKGPFELDRWTTVYLPDGGQCYVKELSLYTGEQ